MDVINKILSLMICREQQRSDIKKKNVIAKKMRKLNGQFRQLWPSALEQQQSQGKFESLDPQSLVGFSWHSLDAMKIRREYLCSSCGSSQPSWAQKLLAKDEQSMAPSNGLQQQGCSTLQQHLWYQERIGTIAVAKAKCKMQKRKRCDAKEQQERDRRQIQERERHDVPFWARFK